MSKLVNFFAYHFNIEDGKKQLFPHIMLYYFKKSKNAAEAKRFVQYMEKALWLIACVKVVCKVSCWSFLAG